MKFGKSDGRLNKRLRDLVQDLDPDAFGDLAEFISESLLYQARSVHDNSDGTARQCAAYFFGLRNGLGRRNYEVATAICRNSRRLKRPPRLYVLVKRSSEEYLFAHIGHWLKDHGHGVDEDREAGAP
jgi:hypothetical protein